jgi:hypothetical protein
MSEGNESSQRNTTEAPPEIIIDNLGKLNGALMGILQGSKLNMELTDSQATNLVDHLSNYFSWYASLPKPRVFDLAYLIGVCFDKEHSNYDRRRFKSAIRYLMENSTATDTFVLSIDPNFLLANIAVTLSTLLRDEDKIPLIVKGKDFKSIKISWNILATSYALKPITNGNEKTKKTQEYKDDFDHFPVLKFIVKNSKGESKNFYFMFLKYPLPIAGGKSFGSRNLNLLNVQEGTKTIQTYLADADCKYTNESFFGALERLAKVKSIHSVYIGSAANSTDRNPLQKFENGKESFYHSKYTVNEFGSSGRYYVGSRYLQDFCQVLSLMKNISDTGKPVYFITMDTRLPAFQHPSVVLTQRNPASKRAFESVETYAVPFDKDTTFFRNDMFEEYKPAAIPKKEREGGRRRTRKQKRKTRKHRV